MKKLFFTLMALLVCASAATAAETNTKKAIKSKKPLSAKALIKQMKKAEGVTILYGLQDREVEYPSKLVVCGTKSVLLPSENPEFANFYPKESTYVDYARCTTVNMAALVNGDTVCSKRNFEVNKGFKVVGDTTYMGLKCKVARTIINSNTMEVWYTTELGLTATPTPGWGVTDGVVLFYSRNGQRKIVAKEIIPMKKAVDLFPASFGKEMDPNYYRYALNHSNVITVPVFKNDSVRFSGEKAPYTIEPGVCYHAGGGTIIFKKVKLPNSTNRDVFVELTQYSNGDAYDRTGSVFVIPTDKQQSFLDAMRELQKTPGFKSKEGKFYPALVSTPEYTAPLELMRFFTGFGVRHFNYNVVPGQEWVDSVLYKQNVSALKESLQGEVIIGAYIGNWDANGHSISMNLKYYPGDEEEGYKNVKPLFNTVNYLEQAGQEYPTFLGDGELKVRFTMEEDADNVMLYFTTTGHGGWGGGDEFNRKVNSIYLDGEKVISFIPWRDDCATYRNNNPCSGNFSNGESSSDLSRSNWCPGTVTNPNYIALGKVSKGEHEIIVRIPQGAPEGGSLSYWCLSGTLLY